MKMLKWPLKSSFRDRGCHTEKGWRSENKWDDVENDIFLQGGTSHEMRNSETSPYTTQLEVLRIYGPLTKPNCMYSIPSDNSRFFRVLKV